MKRIYITFSLLFFICLNLPGLQTTIEGKVIKVLDGDSIILLIDNNKYETRLEGVDAPEYSQPYGEEAKNFLKELILYRKVTAVAHQADKYGRTVATVYYNGDDINLEMVRNGYAWVYRYYTKDKELINAEKYAKKKKLGLWKQNKPEPPWDYRRKNDNYNTSHRY